MKETTDRDGVEFGRERVEQFICEDDSDSLRQSPKAYSVTAANHGSQRDDQTAFVICILARNAEWSGARPGFSPGIWI